MVNQKCICFYGKNVLALLSSRGLTCYEFMAFKIDSIYFIFLQVLTLAVLS